jgi:hypothetical protein
MRNLDLSDEEIFRLEQEHKKLCPKPTDKELVEALPDAILYLRQRIRRLKKVFKALQREILADLSGVYSLRDEDSRNFYEQVVEILKGEKLEELKNEINHWKYILFPSPKSVNFVTEEQKKRAKAYPFDRLIEAKSNMAHCQFHSPDKHPSFSIKNNFGHCFACGWSGDTIKFLMDSQSLSFKQAVEALS